ncbi:MAG: alpha/beta hydrolase [Chloroflexi bacterium]|nr:alpha/beta hydrolase [Chloroflexota bacterium]
MPSFRSRLIQTIIRDLKDALLSNVPIEKRRSQAEDTARRGVRVPRGVTTHSITASGVPAERLSPEASDPQRVLLYLHGGGYVIGSIATHRGLASRIAIAAKARLLLIDYRLAPEHPFPAALEDALSAYRWLLAQGVDPRHLAIGGDSAGGGLTLATALSLRDHQEPLPAALFLLSPWTDLTFSGDSIKSRAQRDPVLSINDNWLENTYAGDQPLTHPLISPLFADLTSLPPTIIQVGTEEILYDDSTRLAERARRSGMDATLEVWEGMWHVFQGFAPYVPEAGQAIGQIGVFLKKHIP